MQEATKGVTGEPDDDQREHGLHRNSNQPILFFVWIVLTTTASIITFVPLSALSAYHLVFRDQLSLESTLVSGFVLFCHPRMQWS